MAEDERMVGDFDADWALSCVERVIASSGTVTGLAEEMDAVHRAYEKEYGEDADASPFLVWMFAMDMYGTSIDFVRGWSNASDVLEMALAWKPHLQMGEDAWRRTVEAGDWPIKWDDES